MKNLKRVLSLVLATVMVIGMMVVGASAADYKDADKIDYAEAVDVMSAVGMIEGYDGNFGPEGKIDRAGATKLITYLMLGTDVAKKLTVTEAPFEDVPANAWYAPFVAFCAEKGLLEGYNGKFYPNEPINAYGFAKLLLGALGYRADIENLTGDTWQVNVATLAIQNGLFDGNDGAFANQDMTRQEACLYAFNALKATMVTYEGGTNVTLPGGGSVVVNAVRKNVANTKSDYDGAGNGNDNLMQLCEYLYPQLTLDAGAADDFGRTASHGWYLEKGTGFVCNSTDVRVYSAMNTPTVTFTAATTASDIVKALKGFTFGGIKLVDTATIYRGAGVTLGDLTLARTNNISNVLAALTGNGKVVEIYVDDNGAVVDVIALDTTVETINNIITAGNGDKTYNFSVSGNKVDRADEDAIDTVMLYGEFAKGDVVTTVQGTNYLHVYPTTVIEGAQSAFNGTKETITVNGTVYEVATGVTTDGSSTYLTAATDFNTNSTAAYKYFLDQYGYVVATTSISTVYTNYAQVKANLSSLTTTIDGSTPAVEARFVLADGTVEVYDVKLTKDGSNYKLLGTEIYGSTVTSEGAMQTKVNSLLAKNKVFAYSLDGNTISLQSVGTSVAADTVYQGTVTTIVTGSTVATVQSQPTLLDKDTIYVLYDAAKGTATAYTGTLPANTKLTNASTTVIAVGASSTRGTAKVVFGLASNQGTVASGDYAYIDNTEYTTELVDKTNYRVYEGVKADGTTVTVYGKNDGSDVTTAGLYTWDSDMKVTGPYAGREAIAARRYHVVGDQMMNGAGTLVLNMDGAEIVYVDSTKTTVDGSICIVVREMDGTTITNNAAVIFVVG